MGTDWAGFVPEHVPLWAKAASSEMEQMARTVKVRGSDKMIEDLETLKEKMGAKSYDETIRRVLAEYVILREQVERCSLVKIRGKNGNGDEVEVIMT